MTAPAAADKLTAFDWFQRLGPLLRERRPVVEYWQRYFDGDHDLPAGPQQHKDAYRRFQKLARTNLCDLCVNSRVHRMRVTGYRDGSARGGNDKAIWGLWQAARLDARQATLYRKAFTQGESYAIAGPGKDRGKPRVTIESALHVIVATDPADASERLAALRLWHDPIAARWMATVYMPGWRHAYVSTKEYKTGEGVELSFDPQSWTTREEPARSTSMIPVFPYSNGDEGDDPRSAFAGGGLDVQNRLNLTLLNRLTAERYGAFRQRYLLNYTPEEDEVTGLPVPPFNPGADQTFTIPPPETPGDPEPRIGDLAQTDTSNMLRGCEADIGAFASTTLTPVYYLPGGDLVNISADALVALDAGHTAAIRERMSTWGEVHEDLLSCMAEFADIDRELDAAEIVWDRPEAFNPAAVADYLTKMTGAGVPLPLAVEQVGWTPQQIERLRTEMTADAMRQALAQPLTGPATPAGTPTPPRVGAPSQGPPAAPAAPAPPPAAPGTVG